MRVAFGFWWGDKPLGSDVWHPSIKEFVLKDETPSVYKVTRRSALSGHDEVIVTVVFEFDKVIYDDKDVLELGVNTYTFDTYEHFLKFLDSTLREKGSVDKVTVSLTDRKTRVSLLWLFESPLAKKKGLNIHPVKLTNLQRYQTLSDESKKQVDEILCPIKLDKDCVSGAAGVNHLGFINLVIDKTDLVKEYFITNDWNGLIKQKLSKPVDKVDLI